MNHDIILFIVLVHHKASETGITIENLYFLLFVSAFPIKKTKKHGQVPQLSSRDDSNCRRCAVMDRGVGHQHGCPD